MIPPPVAREGDSKRPRGIVVLAGYVGVIAGVWGHDLVACRGFVPGAISALQRLAFLVFVSPPVLATVLGLFAGCTVAAFALAALPAFRQRRELLLIVLPVAMFLVGYGVAASGDLAVRCSLSPWR
jgi:hypothetical protein